MKRYACSGCSLLCDDIIVRTDGLFIDEVLGACLKGKERFDFLTSEKRIVSPLIRSGEELKKVSWDEALQKAAEILNNSKKPLFYGFSNSTCETQSDAIELTKQLNGFIDSNSTICQGKVLERGKETGITLSTLAETINKSDLLILWGANPAESIPRFLNKTLFTRGKFRMTGREIKTLVIIDPIKTASFNVLGARDMALRIEPNKDLDLINILKSECCTEGSIPEEGVAGIDQDDLKRLLMHLTGAENAVVFLGQGILRPYVDHDLIKELLELFQMINKKQESGRISLILLGGHFNMAGFDQVSLSQYGKNGGHEFQDGKLLDKTDTIISKLENDDFDVSFIVGTDPISHLPQKLSKKLLKKPLVVVDSKKTFTSRMADVILPSAISGIETDGMAYRLDNIPVVFEKIMNPPNNILSDEEIMKKLLKLTSNTSGGNE